MNELCDVFDRKNFPTQRMDLIWLEVKDLDKYQFKRIVDNFIGNKPIQYPPLVKDFIECANEQRQLMFEKKLNNFATAIQHSEKPDGTALRDLLKKTGSKSLLDLIKNKKGETND